jgi:dTDP-4-amino-4,6-dideoxygalactose transaminase
MIPGAKPEVGEDERLAVETILSSGMLAQGPEVRAFEGEFATAVSVDQAVALNSGTSALHTSLLALDIGKGDEVVVPSFTFAATANAVALSGATPVFADIDPDSFCLSPKSIEAATSPKTRAIMPVHLYGHPANMTEIMDLANELKLLVIEDAAQAHLASWTGNPVGSIGDVGCFSFYPTKNMTSGEGGMVATKSAQTARIVRLLRNQGMEERYKNEIVGLNNRMTDIHAAIGRVQLRKLPGWTKRRQAIAARYDQELRGVVTPTVAPEATHVYHQYTVRIADHERDAFATELANRGVGTGVYYPIPVHRLPSFNQTLDLPETERAAAEVLSLPIYPALTDGEVDQVIDAVNAVAGAGA